MMRIYDRLMLGIYSLALAGISVILMLLPFDSDDFLSTWEVANFIHTIKGNYWYSLLGLGLLVFSLWFLFSGLRSNKNNTAGANLSIRNEFGEIIIYQDTIIGLVHYVANKFNGIKNVKTKVEFSEGHVNLSLRGEVAYELNIPETSKELQSKVKEHIENTIGATVGDIKLEIVNVSSPVMRAK